MDLVNDEPELSALMLGHEEFGKNPKIYVGKPTLRGSLPIAWETFILKDRLASHGVNARQFFRFFFPGCASLADLI